MGTIENFVENFHNLDGITIDEKERSFRKLIHKNISLLQNDKWNENIAKMVTPRTHLEKLFKVDLLITCQKTGELLEILTTGNEVLINRIIKHGWFIHVAFQEMSAEEITENLLPQLSYSIRMKLLKKISIHLNDETKLYELFNTVKSRYGINVAMCLILGCSETRLESIIKNNPIFFTPTQLRRFIRRASKLLPTYVEEYIKHKDNYDFLQDRELIRYIAAIDYDVYYNLHKKYNIRILCGKRATRKMFEKHRIEILKKPDEYEDMFQRSVFIRKLCAYGSFKKYLIELFPKNMDMFLYTKYSDIEFRLRFFQKSKRLQLLEECFEEVYKVPIYDCPRKISTDILDMISDSKKRQEIVMNMMNLDDNIKYVIYQETSNSVPFIKNEIDLASNDWFSRRELVRGLVETCKINEELNTLKQVTKYVTSRFRNDPEMLNCVLGTIQEIYDFHIFDKDIWELIIQMINIQKVKDADFLYIDYIDKVLLSYSEFLFNESGEIAEESILQYLKSCYERSKHIFVQIYNTKPKFIRNAITKAIVLLPKVTKKEDLNEAYCTLASTILDWNNDHKDFAISINEHPIFFECLKNQKGEYGWYSDTGALLCTKDRSDEVMELLDFYWSKSSTFNEKFILYYLKWYPTTFLENIKYSVNGLLRLYSYCGKMFKMINKYEHINLPQKMINCIQEALVNIKKSNDESDYSEIPINSKTFAALAHLMNPEDYISYIAKYQPEKLIIDMSNDDEKEMFKVQCFALENLKYLPSPITIPYILQYCGGDFLANVLAGLYKSFYRTPENKLLPFIDQLMNNSVSVRKHSATLAIHLLDLHSIENICKSLLIIEQNDSLKKRFRISLFKLFQHNPTDSFWSLFKCTLTSITNTDKESFESLVNMSYFPFKYILLYFEEIWHLVDNSNLVEAQKYSLRNALCSKMTSKMKNLSLEMSSKVINKLFMKFSHMYMYDGSVINKFVCEFLYQNPKSERFTQIFKILDSAKNSSVDICPADILKEICIFINDFCDFFIADNSLNWSVDLTKEFLQQLCNLYTPIEFFSQVILASLVSILIDLQGTNIELYATRVSSFSRNIFDTYGPYVIDILISNVVKSLKFFNKSDDYTNVKVEFIKELLKIDKSELSYKISLEIISTCSCDFCEYKEALDIIKSCEYSGIQILLRQKSLYSKCIE